VRCIEEDLRILTVARRVESGYCFRMKFRRAVWLGTLAGALLGCAGAPAAPRHERSRPTRHALPVASASPVVDTDVKRPLLVEGPTWFPYEGFELAARRGTALDGSGVPDMPAGKHGRVTRKGERFVFADGSRVEFWGATFSGDGSFPEPERADALAEYCSGLGFNLARHTLRTPTPELLERFDTFAARLTARGVYLALDFELEGDLDEARVLEFEEGIRSTLSRRNAETRRTYAQDPALAIVFVTRSGPAAGSTPREAFELEARFRQRIFEGIRKAGYKGLLAGQNPRLEPNLELALNALADVGSTALTSLPARDPALVFREGPVMEAALRRVAGRPYVVSDGPSPLPLFQADRLALMAVYAGLSRFTVTDLFSSRVFTSLDAGCAPGELAELRCQPGLLALMPALSRLVVRRDLREPTTRVYPPLRSDDLLDSGALRPSLPHGVGYVTSSGFDFDLPGKPSAEVEWVSRYAKGDSATSTTGEVFVDFSGARLEIDAPRNQGIVGRSAGERRSLSNLTVQVEPGWSAIWATSLDRHVLAKTTRILISAVGRVSYRGMALDPEGTTIAEMGALPLMLEPVVGSVALGGLGGDTAGVSVYTLNSAGERVISVPISTGPGSVHFEMRPEYRALHYEVVR
jgi:hypothetical protein